MSAFSKSVLAKDVILFVKRFFSLQFSCCAQLHSSFMWWDYKDPVFIRYNSHRYLKPEAIIEFYKIREIHYDYKT